MAKAGSELALVRQVSALPFRRGQNGGVQILLITSRGSGRWIIAKDWRDTRLTAHESAAREALEEAGLTGEVEAQPIGSFRYIKKARGAALPCLIDVYPLRVETARTWWRERGQRQRRWCSLDEALSLVELEGLRQILSSFCNQNKPGLARHLR
jgi:8-oxo-dGTP pyrophosphatase MutT (NUDIX family)